MSNHDRNRSNPNNNLNMSQLHENQRAYKQQSSSSSSSNNKRRSASSSSGGHRHHHGHGHSHGHHHHRGADKNDDVVIFHKRLRHSDPRYRSEEDFESIISPCVKYSLFFFNFIFWLIGIVMIGLGGWSFSEEILEVGLTRLPRVSNVLHFVLHVSFAMMFVGGITFLMSFAGCLGALRENICLLKLYSFMLLFLFIGEVVLSTVAFVFPNAFLHYFKEGLSKDLVMKYRDDANLQNLIDSMHTGLKCCGVSDKGYKDWSQNIYFNCSTSNPSPERCGVPYSCCRNARNFDSGLINIMCGNSIQNTSSVVEVNKYIYTRGCIEAFTEVFERNMNLAAGVCLACATIQLFAMFLARSLQGQIYSQRARWM